MLIKSFSVLFDEWHSFGEFDQSDQPVLYLLPRNFAHLLFQQWISASLFMVNHVSLHKKGPLSFWVQYPVEQLAHKIHSLL